MIYLQKWIYKNETKKNVSSENLGLLHKYTRNQYTNIQKNVS